MSASHDTDLLVSTVIPVKNGGATIRQCLEALFAQNLANRMEVILIDSGSIDDTLEIAAGFPVRVLPVDPQTFNHGLTRNFGVDHARGEFIYFTVQDAKFSSHDALDRMVSHFRDQEVMGVNGRQAVAWETGNNPVHWHRPISAPGIERYQFPDPAVFTVLPPADQLRLAAWDNVNAMYRKSALEQLPFVRTDFAEDMCWAKSALEKGWAIIHDTGALTWHYHHRTFSYSFRSTMILHYSTYQLFKILPPYPPIYSSLKVIPVVLWREKAIGFRQKWYWFVHSLADFWGKYYATLIFRKTARTGDDNKIRNLYERYCSRVPQGRLKGQ